MIVGVTDAAENISFKAMMERLHAVSEIVRQRPGCGERSASVGAGTVNATVNTARLYIVLKPHDRARERRENHRTAARCDAQCRRHLALHASGAGCADRCRVSRTQFQYILQDADAAELAEWAPKLVQKLGQLPQLADVASDQQVERPATQRRCRSRESVPLQRH